jgi:hypothetical protein
MTFFSRGLIMSIPGSAPVQIKVFNLCRTGCHAQCGEKRIVLRFRKNLIVVPTPTLLFHAGYA